MTDASEREGEDVRIGLVLEEKYRVDEVLGHGGMGTIYRGTRLDLGERVAMKFLHRMFASTSELRARFKQEAIALSRLRHPAIVALLDFGEHDGELYMVMELVKGDTLSAVLERETKLALPFVGEVFDQLLEVLHLAHSEGIVHRDLKPSNVMIIPPTHVKLLDFGLVHLPANPDIERLTETGVIHGTPDYMSPEQCQGEVVGPKTDVYALGAMLYECVVGHAPFEGRGAGKLMAAHLFVPPPSLPKALGLPAALDALIRRALSKVADQRPTAEEMRRELGEVIRGTDAMTMMDRVANARAHAFSLERSERALTGRPPAPEVGPGNATGETAETGPRGEPSSSVAVAIEIEERERAASIRSALAVVGIAATFGKSASAGVRILDARTFLAASLEASRPEVGDRDRHRQPLVLIIDVADTDEMRECIRRGASDVVLAHAPSTDITTRVKRLFRRGR